MDVFDCLRLALFPESCLLCGARGSAFCSECAPFVHDRVDEHLIDADLPLRCLGEYGGNLRSAVLKLKEGRRDVAHALAHHLAERVSDLDWLSDAVLVPIPTAPHRVRLRGLDGVAYLASVIAEKLDLSVEPMLRSRAWSAQHGRNRNERLDATGRFVFQKKHHVVKRQIVLVDDVVTTGATIDQATKLLRTGGMRVYGSLALARTSISIP